MKKYILDSMLKYRIIQEMNLRFFFCAILIREALKTMLLIADIDNHAVNKG